MSNNSLNGRVAIVTGASRGIGSAIAQRLASAGATIVLAARSIDQSADGLDGTADEVARRIKKTGGDAVAIACDVEDDGSRASLIETTIKKFGRIDILVNNAGRTVLDPVWDMRMSVLRSRAEQYLFGPLDLLLRAIPHMKKQGEGWITNLGSSSAMPVLGRQRGDSELGPGHAFYGALKAGVHRLSAGLASELYDANIAVNVVSPVSAIATPGVVALGVLTPETEKYFERVEHIAEAALALVSRPPRELTGVVAFSWQYLDSTSRSTMSLDGREVVHARG